MDPLFLTAHQAVRCALHPALAAPWVCVACHRGHCGACHNRFEHRLTPPGTCLQCGGRLQAVHVDSAADTEAGLTSAVRQAYQPLGLACSAALALPLLYGGLVPVTLLQTGFIAAAAAWTYFLAVVRWRAMTHAGLPLPAHVLGDLRQSMAVLPGFLAVLLALAPALWMVTAGAGPVAVLPAAAAGLLWLPVPVLAAAARPSLLAPLLPLTVLAAVRADPGGYLSLAWRVLALTGAVALAGLALLATLGRLPILGPWLVAVAVLPGAWATALVIGRWGQARSTELGLDG